MCPCPLNQTSSESRKWGGVWNHLALVTQQGFQWCNWEGVYQRGNCWTAYESPQELLCAVSSWKCRPLSLLQKPCPWRTCVSDHSSWACSPWWHLFFFLVCYSSFIPGWEGEANHTPQFKGHTPHLSWWGLSQFFFHFTILPLCPWLTFSFFSFS